MTLDRNTEMCYSMSTIKVAKRGFLFKSLFAPNNHIPCVVAKAPRIGLRPVLP